jgi:hypothetical protein
MEDSSDARYQRGKIYAIESAGAGLRYIGSTVNELNKRFAEHRAHAKNPNRERPLSSKELFQHPDVRVILIENWPCSSKAELLAREQYHIRLLDCVNKNMPGRTRQDYREEFAEQIKEKKKVQDHKYYMANAEALKAYQKEYAEANKEKVKARAKAYTERTKAARDAYKKEWYEQNKVRILAERKENANCDICGLSMAKGTITRHKKTQHPATLY